MMTLNKPRFWGSGLPLRHRELRVFEKRCVCLTTSRQGRDKCGRHRGAATPTDELSRESAATCGNMRASNTQHTTKRAPARVSGGLAGLDLQPLFEICPLHAKPVLGSFEWSAFCSIHRPPKGDPKRGIRNKNSTAENPRQTASRRGQDLPRS